ncbi:Zinc finger, PHD-type [Corchorus capsularis]|uniref:Zinc finger, PHD-type n=1 Tax=Corchorus capsularis TaxID=210143 RepID=A0A1R3H835_COCAP|nr:Zinc finger, PHD-type [Corchorus capsularis]
MKQGLLLWSPCYLSPPISHSISLQIPTTKHAPKLPSISASIDSAEQSKKAKKRYASEELNLDNLAHLDPQWWVVRGLRQPSSWARTLARNFPDIDEFRRNYYRKDLVADLLFNVKMNGGKEEMDGTLRYLGHEHPLAAVVQDGQITTASDQYCRCYCCGEAIINGTPSYCCSLKECKFFLHKSCAELELPPRIDHALHPQHPLDLVVPEIPGGYHWCDFCGSHNRLLISYYCASCSFRLDVRCALLISLAEIFLKSVHDHPLVLLESQNFGFTVTFFQFLDYGFCITCKKSISSLPIYKCFHCEDKFSLHKECAELPRQINHPYDRLHRLSLFPSPVSHQEECSCYSCKIIKWDGLVYRCSPCNIELTLEDVSAPQTISVSDTSYHEHPWTLVPCPMSFTCDFCGLEGDRTPYICTTCNLVVHRKCTKMPRAIRIARHRHPISHVYSLQQSDDDRLYEECRICYERVMARYGSYFCSAPNCNYIAHVHCATDPNIWDGTIVLEDDEMTCNEFDLNMITDVISEVSVGEDEMAMEIKHAFHPHNLMLSFKDQIMDDNICHGCMRLISSTHFYNCKKCSFFLHKSCAELPRVYGHPIHKHLLKLEKSEETFLCTACDRLHDGFMYTCDHEDCRYLRGRLCFKLDIQCSLLPDSLRHPSHEHRLFLSLDDHRGDCRGCPEKGISPAYRCTKRCDFAVDVRCLTLPETAKYKYDRHPLTLAYYDKSDPKQIYCDVWEEERDSSNWFYHCARCDNSLHQECALGQLPFIQIGSTCKLYRHKHGHFTFVENIWDCPPCNSCREICYRQSDTQQQQLSARERRQLRNERRQIDSLGSSMVGCSGLQGSWSRDKPRSWLEHSVGTSQKSNLRGVVDIDESSCVLGEEEAVCKGHLEITRMPLQVEADMALDDGYTPLLHLAAMNGKASDEEHITKSSLLLGLIRVALVDLKDLVADLLFNFNMDGGKGEMDGTLQYFGHEHPLVFVQDPQITASDQHCGCCGESTEGTPSYCCSLKDLKAFYRCFHCDDIFSLHKECAELPLQINHPYDTSSFTLPKSNFPSRGICLDTTNNFNFRHNSPTSMDSGAMSNVIHQQQSGDDDDRLYEECRICYEKVMLRYGIYFCSAPNCNYIAHVHCATDRNIWDGTVVLEGDEMSSNEFDQNMITDVISEVKVGEDVMAMEIKHAFHDHDLILNFKGEIMDDTICNGCIRPISTTDHFYTCKKCSFFLHKSCAELPRVIGHPIHKHLLKLEKSKEIFFCRACARLYNGFVYTCDNEDCSRIYWDGFKLDIQCSLLPDSLRHPSHEQHRLFLSLDDYKGDCRGCPNKGITTAYRCTKPCDFAVDVRCLTLPQTIGSKCMEEYEPGQHHEHNFTFVDNIWDCPPCEECGKICYRQALKCEECNYTIHWICPRENDLRLASLGWKIYYRM